MNRTNGCQPPQWASARCFGSRLLSLLYVDFSSIEATDRDQGHTFAILEEAHENPQA
jgi:hypothetical protein